MKLRFRLLLLMLTSLFRTKQPMSHISRLKLRVWPVDVDIKKVNIERFFAFGDLGWASMLMDWGIFRQILTSRYAPFGKCLSLSVKGPLWLFQRFEIQTTIIWCDHYWVYAEQQFLSKGQIVAISVIKGGVLQEGRLLKVNQWMPQAELVSVLGKPELVDLYQRTEKAMWRATRG
ncbi:thioesterase family protein [Halopseudomonas sp.]|jgi:hypothetical protein|uniref:thioesterase family protein n=1 Tax=Halopseudomonas sp. TaxID=2901191 RepID=UPI0039E4D985